MARDIVYYFTKDTFKRVELGEIQTDFQGGFCINGNQDSMKVIVFSYAISTTIEPNTIIYHNATNTWWVVSHDQVEKFPNEVGYLYTHTLQLKGAVELLNFRDLTDCGYNQKVYTIKTFIERLLRLSSLEFNDTRLFTNTINYGTLEKTQVVDYVKTYENYTLLNALRDFLDGYNYVPKLTFNTEIDSVKWGDNDTHISGFNLNLVSKVGDVNIGNYNMNVFNEVQEKRNIDSASFGTNVVSNASNVISTRAKTFPTCGTAQLTDVSENVSPSTARLVLPSNIFKVNWLKICSKVGLILSVYYGGSEYGTSLIYVNGNDKLNSENFDKKALEILSISHQDFTQIILQQIYDYVVSKKQEVLDICNKASSITLYNCDRWNSYDKTWVKPNGAPDNYYTRTKKFQGIGQEQIYDGRLVLCPKDLKDNLPQAQKSFGSIGWERGKDYIENFGCLSSLDVYDKTYVDSFEYTDINDSSYDNNASFLVENFIWFGGNRVAKVSFKLVDPSNEYLKINNTSFVVNYIPMGDLKLKFDNRGIGNDSNLYNQNGKLNDSTSLSKMLLSHSKEIEGETITKNGVFTSFNSVPKVGSIVVDSGKTYVVENVSCDFSQNECATDKVSYYVSCVFTLSQNISTKSILVSPNTNVRDYGIPQTYNIKRKQLYRDFYELTWLRESDNAEWKTPIDKVLNLSNFPQDYVEHIAVMKIEYENAFGGDTDNGVAPKSTWYYQLNTTTYLMKKAIYEVVDFKDNNIIGYSTLNVSSGFDISKLLHGFQTMSNTPVSYVDDNGRFSSIQIAFCNAEQLTEIYKNYENEYSVVNDRTLYNSGAFIDEKIYEGSYTNTTYHDYSVSVEVNGNLASTVHFTNSIHININEFVQQIGFNGSDTDIALLGYGLWVNDSVMTITNVSFEKEYGEWFVDIDVSETIPDNGTYTLVATGFRVNGYLGAKDSNDFKIVEYGYLKDALEVPVFEYSCQLDDTDDVLVGEDIFDNDTNDDVCYIYPVVATLKNRTNQNNWQPLFVGTNLTVRPNVDTGQVYEDDATMNGYRLIMPCAKLTYFNNEIRIRLYDAIEIKSNGEVEYGLLINPTTFAIWNNSDLSIGRYTIKKTDKASGFNNTGYVNSDLMFVLKNMENAIITDNEIIVRINYYKVK